MFDPGLDPGLRENIFFSFAIKDIGGTTDKI